MFDIDVNLTSWLSTFFHLFLAMLCGGLIGYERESINRPAGFRTHVLVCVGSAIYMMASAAIAGKAYDPGRIAAQVASGIGFLGAGTIIKQGNLVRGLTTAASLWAVAGIGLAAGIGGQALHITIISTIVVYCGLRSLKWIEVKMDRTCLCNLAIAVNGSRETLNWIQDTLAAHNIEVRSLTIHEDTDTAHLIEITGRTPSTLNIEKAVSAIASGPSTTSVTWDVQ